MVARHSVRCLDVHGGPKNARVILFVRHIGLNLETICKSANLLCSCQSNALSPRHLEPAVVLLRVLRQSQQMPTLFGSSEKRFNQSRLSQTNLWAHVLPIYISFTASRRSIWCSGTGLIRGGWLEIVSTCKKAMICRPVAGQPSPVPTGCSDNFFASPVGRSWAIRSNFIFSSFSC